MLYVHVHTFVTFVLLTPPFLLQIPKVHLPESVCVRMLQSSLTALEPSWDWVVSLMDVAEGQLQRGSQFDTQVNELSGHVVPGPSAVTAIAFHMGVCVPITRSGMSFPCVSFA